MAKKKYPNTPWGRDAKWEDEQGSIQQEVNNETPREYVRTYKAAQEMMKAGRKPKEIRAELHQKPPYDPENPPSDSHAYRVADGLVPSALRPSMTSWTLIPLVISSGANHEIGSASTSLGCVLHEGQKGQMARWARPLIEPRLDA